MNKKVYIKAAAAALGLCLLLESPCMAAAGPGRADEREDGLTGEYDEEKRAALLDDVVEYDELADLIHEFNPTVSDARKSIEESVDEAQALSDALAVERYDSRALKEEAEDEGDMEAYVAYAQQEEIYKNAVMSYNRQIRSLNRSASSSSLRRTEESLTASARSLMISYESLRLQKETLEKSLELYEEQYRILQVQRAAGLATAAEVYEVRDTLLAGQASLAKAEVDLDSVYESLCGLVGRDGDEGLVIARIPEADENYIGSINREEDLTHAKWNNSSVVSVKHTSAFTTSETKRKKASIASGEELVAAELEALYQKLLEAEAGYEAETAAYLAAQMEKQLADIKYEQGMQSRGEYLLEELSYVQSQASYETAKLQLVQAIETYERAVAGDLSIDL